jgi:UDP-3-O-[3-hydroxymyristoyl] glucosamine N-acyltransferase
MQGEDNPHMGMALGELADYIGGVLNGDPDCTVTSVATLQDAGEGAISFLANPRYRKYLYSTRATAVILTAEQADSCPTATITVHDPYLAYARAAALLFPAENARLGVHPDATIGANCRIDPTAWVGPRCVIEDNVVLAAGVQLQGHCLIGKGSCIGRDGIIKAQVTICHDVTIGERVLVHPGAVIGSDGFGLAEDKGQWIKVPQLGRVVIGDDVEIGANTTIDRGTIGNTVIENGVKLDNQVHIAHNVCIGSHTAIAGCTGISGSTKIGSHCRIGGGVGILGHLDIVDHVTVTAMTLVTKSLSAPGVYSSGIPAQENITWNRNIVSLRELGDRAGQRQGPGKGE